MILINHIGVFYFISAVIRISFSSEIVDIPYTTDKNSIYLYDINNDPYEDYNLAHEHEYHSTLLEFNERRFYWSQLTLSNSNDKSISDYIEMNGPITNPRKDIVQVYDPLEPPNIVFVLVDDWGYNDYGGRSTYMNWVNPTLTHLANEGVLLENYYTSEVCGPSRGSLLTGRYALRLGLIDANGVLPISETTIAEELKTAGYRTYIIGKWHLGHTTTDYYPTERGFDYFYGFLDGYETYWSKEYDNVQDLYEGTNLVTNQTELSKEYHAGYLFQDKVESVIESHVSNYPNTPMFLYYAMQLIHYPFTAPDIYLERCTKNYNEYSVEDDSEYIGGASIPYNYCAMNVMMDEAIANLTCQLSKHNMADNTILIISGDNGGNLVMNGNNYPFKGAKDTAMRGAFANTAIIHSKLLPESLRGTTYQYDVHITDWFPTIMGLATEGLWSGSYNDAEIDGVDLWSSLINRTSTTRNEIVLASKPRVYDNAFISQMNGIKYIYHCNTTDGTLPEYYFEEDLNPSLRYQICSNPSLIDSVSVLDMINLEVGALHDMYQSIIHSSNDVYSKLLMIMIVIGLIVGLTMLYWVIYYPKSLSIPVNPSSTSLAESQPLLPGRV